MKRLVFMLMLLVSTNSFGQSFGLKKTKFLDRTNSYAMIMGGAFLTIGVATTTMEYTRLGNSTWSRTPYVKQTAQMGGLVSGIAITGTGLISLALTKKKNRKKFKR